MSYFEQIIAFSTIVSIISKLSKITLKLARATHFPMVIFYISIYLIKTTLLNALSFCSKMPLSDDSCRTEICRALRSIGVCTMRVFAAWYYRTDKRSKNFLNLSLFFFINKFHLAILMDHHFTSITIGQKNDCSFVTTKEPFYVTETNSVRKISVLFSAINMAVLFFLFFFMVTVSFHQKLDSSQLYCLF